MRPTSLGTSSRIEPIWLMWHLEEHYFCAGRIVSFHLPAFRTHVARAEEGHSAIAFSQDHAVINLAGGEAGVYRHIELGQRVLQLAVEVGTLGWLVDTVEAIYLKIGGIRQTGFEWIDPLAMIRLVLLE